MIEHHSCYDVGGYEKKSVLADNAMTMWLGHEKCCRRAKKKIDGRRRLNDQVEEEGELDDSNHPGGLPHM